MKKANSNKAGGSRPGAGRPKGEEKKAIGLRVPVKYHAQLVKIVKGELKRLQLLKQC